MSASAETTIIEPSATDSHIHEIVVEYGDTPTNRIVFIAVDSSKHSDYAFQWALDNFLQQSDLVIVSNVRPYPVAPGYGSPYMVISASYSDFSELITNLEGQHRLESHTLLNAFAERLKTNNIPCRAIAMRGDAREEIVRKVVELNADVLIMGSRGLGALKRTLLGSVSDYCAHNVPMPIIIVKEPTQSV